MSDIKKLTPELLKRIVVEERNKLKEEISQAKKRAAKAKREGANPREVDADEYASTLEKHVDYAKKLGIHEQKLLRKLSKVVKTRAALKQKIIKEL
tara:strand:- start:263 stop:550 length:288 start_codon:yes stop_codon:yes gene_type:complete